MNAPEVALATLLAILLLGVGGNYLLRTAIKTARSAKSYNEEFLAYATGIFGLLLLIDLMLALILLLSFDTAAVMYVVGTVGAIWGAQSVLAGHRSDT